MWSLVKGARSVSYICISCNMCTRDLPDKYRPSGFGHTHQANHK